MRTFKIIWWLLILKFRDLLLSFRFEFFLFFFNFRKLFCISFWINDRLKSWIHIWEVRLYQARWVIVLSVMMYDHRLIDLHIWTSGVIKIIFLAFFFFLFLIKLKPYFLDWVSLPNARVSEALILYWTHRFLHQLLSIGDTWITHKPKTLIHFKDTYMLNFQFLMAIIEWILKTIKEIVLATFINNLFLAFVLCRIYLLV